MAVDNIEKSTKEFRKKRRRKTRIAGIVWCSIGIVVASCYFLFSISMYAMMTGSRGKRLYDNPVMASLENDGAIIPVFVVCGLFVCLGIFLFIRSFRRNMSKANIGPLFYSQCIQSGIDNVDSSVNKQKATLLAQRLQIDYDDIVATYEASKKAYEQSQTNKAEREENKQMAELRAAEEAEFFGLMKFSNYHGRDKRLAMIKDEKRCHAESLSEAKKAYSNVMSMCNQKELDWAILGGDCRRNSWTWCRSGYCN